MTTHDINWAFHDSVPAHRAEQLLAYESFDEILELIVETSAIAAFAGEPFTSHRLKGCCRANRNRKANGTLSIRWRMDSAVPSTTEGQRNRSTM